MFHGLKDLLRKDVLEHLQKALYIVPNLQE